MQLDSPQSITDEFGGLFRSPAGPLAELDAGSPESVKRPSRDSGAVAESPEPSMRSPVAVFGIAPCKEIGATFCRSECIEIDRQGLDQRWWQGHGSGPSFFVLGIDEFGAGKVDISDSEFCDIHASEPKSHSELEEESLFEGLADAQQFVVFRGRERLFTGCYGSGTGLEIGCRSCPIITHTNTLLSNKCDKSAGNTGKMSFTSRNRTQTAGVLVGGIDNVECGTTRIIDDVKDNDNDGWVLSSVVFE
jgi:hypothetical protein